MKITKYGAASSIIILAWNSNKQKFQVIKRVEVAKNEYTFENAVNMIIKLNNIYNPAFIYVDAGSGEYQIERLHLYGEQHPSTGLKNKVKRWQFSQTLDITDPITGETNKQPMKPFMVSQLTIAFEQEKMMMSPLDKTLYDQLINYEVERFSQNGSPVFTSKDEHFIDALGLAYLAMVLEFKNLTGQVQDFETTSEIATSTKSLSSKGIDKMFNEIESGYTSNGLKIKPSDADELRGERQTWFKVPNNYRSSRCFSRNSWGSRSHGGYGGRSTW